MSERLRRLLMEGGVRLTSDGARSLRAAEVKSTASGDMIEMVITTSAPCVRAYYDWETDEVVEYDEVLSLQGVQLPEQTGRRINLLDSHNWWSTSAIIGLAETIAVEGEKLVGAFKLSKRSSVADIVEGIREGIICNGSAGYSIDEYSVSEINGRLTVTATKWTLLENSVVPVPADGVSGTRSAHELIAAFRSAPKGKLKMSDDEIRALVASATAEGIRTAMEAMQTPAPTVTEPTVVVVEDGKRSATDEAAIAGLRGIASAKGKTAEFDALVAAGEPLEGLRSVAKSYIATTSGETSGNHDGGSGKRTSQFISHEEASAGRRSASGVDAVALATAIAAAIR